MTEHRSAARLIAHYKEAVEPDSAELDAIWNDLADPDAQFRVVERRDARPKPRRRSRVAIGGGLVLAAAAAAAAWWLGSTARHVTVAGEADPVQAPHHDERSGGADGVAQRRAPHTASEAGVTRDGTPVDPVTPAPAASSAPTNPARSTAPSGESARRALRSVGPDPLSREAALIQRADALLRRGEPARALQVLAEHVREFPQGVLAVERQALRVIALCQGGLGAQGRGEAASVRRHEASKPYRERIRRACDDG